MPGRAFDPEELVADVSIHPPLTRCCTLTAIPLILLAAALMCNLLSASPTQAVPAPAAAPVSRQAVSRPAENGPHPLYLPRVGKAQAPAQHLAFLKDGDVWLAQVLSAPPPPDVWLEGSLIDSPRQLTRNGKVISFAWSSDGQRIAAFDGKDVSFLHAESGWEEKDADTVQIGLPELQRDAIPAMIWTPDGKHVILWNFENPRADIPVGWFMIDAEGGSMHPPIRGRAGKMVALPDGSLVGAIAEACGKESCNLGLYRYDPLDEKFKSYNLDGFSQQGGVGILDVAAVRDQMADPAHLECGYHSNAPDSLALGTHPQSSAVQGKDTPYDLELSPDGSHILLSRGVACNDHISADWATECWLGGGPDVYSMFLWDWKAEEQKKLVPGVFAEWSPQGDWIAFRSCLGVTPFGARGEMEIPPPWIYVMGADGKEETIRPVSEGSFPAWRPAQ